MTAQQTELAWTGSSQHMRIVLKIKVGRELLGDHPMGVMNHKGVTNLVTDISCASMPNFAAKKIQSSDLPRKLYSLMPFQSVSCFPFDRPDRWLPGTSLVGPIASVMSSR